MPRQENYIFKRRGPVCRNTTYMTAQNSKNASHSQKNKVEKSVFSAVFGDSWAERSFGNYILATLVGPDLGLATEPSYWSFVGCFA